jgi:hypothetical protein
MKKLFISLLLIASLGSKAQLVPSIDTSFHPVIDTSLQGITACKIQPIKAALSNDTATRLSIVIISDNLSDLANLSVSFIKSDLSPMKTITFTLQGQNYIDWNNNEYLFKLVATYIKTTYGIQLTFK